MIKKFSLKRLFPLVMTIINRVLRWSYELTDLSLKKWSFLICQVHDLSKLLNLFTCGRWKVLLKNNT